MRRLDFSLFSRPQRLLFRILEAGECERNFSEVYRRVFEIALMQPDSAGANVAKVPGT